MKKLYASDDRVMLYHINNVMKAEGLECIIKNDLMYSLAGEVPVNEVWPELWLIDTSQQKKAETILAELVTQQQPQMGSDYWQCRKCGEKHEIQFTECWRCGFSKSSEL